MTGANLITIPQNPAAKILEFKDENFVEYGILPCGYKSRSIIESDLIVVSNYNKKLLLVLDLELNKVREFKTNDELDRLESKKGICYLGGIRTKKERNPFYKLELKSKSLELLPIRLPVPFKEGKAIDDIAVTDDELVLFDNILYPKYIITYDLRSHFRLDWKKIEKLNDLGTYARIKRGLQNNEWRVILFSTVGRGHCYNALLISGKKNYKKIFDLQEENSLIISNRIYEVIRSNLIYDIAILKDVLYILTRSHLSKVDLNELEIKEPTPIALNDKEFKQIKLFNNSHLFMISEEGYRWMKI